MFTKTKMVVSAWMLVAPVWLVTSGVADAAATKDRFYQFGDDPFEGMPAVPSVPSGSIGTVDSIGVQVGPNFFGYHDLTQTGGAMYADSNDTVPPRPDSTSPREYSMNFDGVNDVVFRLNGGLGSPEAVDGGTVYGSTVNFTGITERAMDGWVYPTDAASVTRQDIVRDTYQFGIYITADNRWGYIHGETANNVGPGLLFPTTTPVAYNAWSHVMHRTFTNTAAVFYLDGVAIAATEGNYDTTPDAEPAMDPNNQIHGDLIFGAGDLRTNNFFQGQLDNFSFYVAGDNSDEMAGGGLSAGKDHGDIDLRVDNDFIRWKLEGIDPGDVDLMNGVGIPDINLLKSNWLKTYEINGREIGDWLSRQQGDLNIDGEIDLEDAYILRQAFVLSGAGAVFDAAFGGSVPEPSSLLLMACGVLAATGLRRRR